MSMREAAWCLGRKMSPSVDHEDANGGLPGGEAMLELLTRLQKYQNTLISQLEVSSHLSSTQRLVTGFLFQSCSGTGIEPLDRDVLLLKATSQAAVHSVKDCLALIKLQQQVVCVCVCVVGLVASL